LSNSAIARAVAIAALAGLTLAALYIARDAILIAYISVVLATGLGPFVHRIERAVPKGARALPRWFAILIIYLGVLFLATICGLLIVPPLIDQAQDLWQRAPQLIDQGQEFLVRHRLLNHHITLKRRFRIRRPGDAMGRSRRR
jgi:predicted PurR-regulated permease PerM